LRHGIGTEQRFFGFTLPQQRPQVVVARRVGARAIQPVDAKDAIGLGQLAGRDHRVDGGRDVAFVFANDRDLVALGLRLELCKALLAGDGHSIFSRDDGAHAAMPIAPSPARGEGSAREVSGHIQQIPRIAAIETQNARSASRRAQFQLWIFS
jgi:hypothetical protein